MWSTWKSPMPSRKPSSKHWFLVKLTLVHPPQENSPLSPFSYTTFQIIQLWYSSYSTQFSHLPIRQQLGLWKVGILSHLSLYTQGRTQVGAMVSATEVWIWITNSCCYWLTVDVFTLSCAPITTFLGHPRAFLPSLSWEPASPQLQLCNPGGAASHSTQPLACRRSHNVWLSLPSIPRVRGGGRACDPSKAHHGSSPRFMSLLFMGSLSKFVFMALVI